MSNLLLLVLLSVLALEQSESFLARPMRLSMVSTDIPVSPVSTVSYPLTGKVETEYGADAITVLEGLEPVRKRPGMYIGSTGQKGLHHLVEKLIKMYALLYT